MLFRRIARLGAIRCAPTPAVRAQSTITSAVRCRSAASVAVGPSFHTQSTGSLRLSSAPTPSSSGVISTTASPYYTIPPLTPKVQELLAGYSDLVTIHPTWGEQDAFGHVNNTVYLRWAEAARIHFLMRLGDTPVPGLEQSVVSSAVTSFLSGVGVGPILKSIYFDFKSSVTYPDLLVIGSRLVSLQQDRFSVTHRLVSCGQERTVGESEGVIVTFDWTSKAKADVPSIVRRALEAAMEEQRQADLIAPMVKPPRATVNFGPQTAGKR